MRSLAALGATCLVALAAGCAGGPWNADGELPVEAAHPYPTAVPSRPHIVQAQISDDEPAESAPGATETPVQKPFKTEIPVTPLAAIPPSLRKAPEPMPSALAAAPAPAAIESPPAAESAAEPAAVQAPVASTEDVVPSTRAATEPAQSPAAPASEANLPPIVSAASMPRPAPAAAPPADFSASAVADVSPVQAAAAALPSPARIDTSWQGLIAAIEDEIETRRAASAADPELPALEQKLRLAYLAAGRMDDAVRGVDSLDPPQREAYKHLMFGLGVWLSPDEARRAPLRSAKVLRSLRDATGELATASKLELKNLVFCDRVDYYGWFNELSRYEFKPKQAVVLYVEVDNFAAEKKATGYETELAGSYQIYDAAGRIVAERQLPLDREVCRNYRRDYFLAYTIYMPDRIADGAYRLELSLEDRKASGVYDGRKLGEGMIEFTIRR